MIRRLIDRVIDALLRPRTWPWEPPMPPPETFDFTKGRRTIGHDITFKLVDSDGCKLTGSGWSTPRPNKGDYILLSQVNGDTTRYRVTFVQHLRDPDDMWHADLEFAPRDRP